jgi:hypothetical protein
MDESSTQAAASTETSGASQDTGASTTGAATNDAGASSTSAQTQAQPGQAGQPTPYVPNYKFKAYDTEGEFDEFIRGVIKDKDTEEKVRTLYAKSHALDEMRGRYTKHQEDYKGVKEKYDTLSNNINHLGHYLKQGDLHNFFDGVGVTKDQVYKWALQQLQLEEMPTEQRQALQEQSELRKRTYMLEQQTQQAQSVIEQFQVQQRGHELDTALNSAESRDFATMFDTKVGKPGAFRQAVIKQALGLEAATRRDVSVAEAIQETIAAWKPFLGAQQTSSAPMAQPAAPQSNGATQPKVIPNVSGRSTSPAAKKITSIEDLKRLSEEN